MGLKLIPTPPPVPLITNISLTVFPQPSRLSSAGTTKQFRSWPFNLPLPYHILPPGTKRFDTITSLNLLLHLSRFPFSAEDMCFATRSQASSQLSSWFSAYLCRKIVSAKSVGSYIILPCLSTI